MLKKIALCAMLVLFLAPATVMAVGQQGEAQGIGNEAGTCLNVQDQATTDTAAQEKSQNGQGEGSESAPQKGDAQMDQTRSCDKDCDQDQDMAWNMTRDQVRLDSDSGPANEKNGAASDGDARMDQTRSCDQDCDQDQDMARNMTRDQVRLDSDSVQHQDRTSESAQNQAGLIEGNGQDILSGFAGQMEAQLRYMGGVLRTILSNTDVAPVSTS